MPQLDMLFLCNLRASRNGDMRKISRTFYQNTFKWNGGPCFCMKHFASILLKNDYQFFVVQVFVTYISFPYFIYITY